MERDGFLLLPGFFDRSTAAWIRAAVDDLDSKAGRSTAGASELIAVPEAGDPKLVCRYEHILAADPQLRTGLLKALSPVLCQLCGEPMVLFKDKLNNKHPGGGAYRPHQDIVAYRSFGPHYHLTAMIAIDTATESNGCLAVAEEYRDVAESRPELVAEELDGLPIFRHTWGHPDSHGDILPEVASEFRWRLLPQAGGDLVVFDSYVPHRSEINESASSRRAMFLTFSMAREGDCYEHYYQEKLRNPFDPRFHVSTPTQPRF